MDKKSEIIAAADAIAVYWAHVCNGGSINEGRKWLADCRAEVSDPQIFDVLAVLSKAHNLNPRPFGAACMMLELIARRWQLETLEKYVQKAEKSVGSFDRSLIAANAHTAQKHSRLYPHWQVAYWWDGYSTFRADFARLRVALKNQETSDFSKVTEFPRKRVEELAAIVEADPAYQTRSVHY